MRWVTAFILGRSPESTPWLSATGAIPQRGSAYGATGALNWAGESVGGVTRVQPAAGIVAELAGEAERLLHRWGHEDGALAGP